MSMPVQQEDLCTLPHSRLISSFHVQERTWVQGDCVLVDGRYSNYKIQHPSQLIDHTLFSTSGRLGDGLGVGVGGGLGVIVGNGQGMVWE